jgi:diguanylate cyclase (GGDEF)-like protein
MIIRHRFTLIDVSMIALMLLSIGFFAWQIDVFPEQTSRSRELMLELDEVLGLIALGFGLFSWSRLRAQRRETGRRIAAEAEARALAFQDPLTGLPNRRQFDQAVRAALAQPPRAGGAHAVLLLDLNGFKKINDLHGHPVGDEALIQVASRLRSAVREGDLVARLGGDEFAVLAHHVSGPEAASGAALRIIDSLAAPVEAGGTTHRMGCGVGIALTPQDGTEIEALLRKADVALYRAKVEDGSTLRFFEPEMDHRLRERDGMERALRGAIGSPALRPHYQPLVDLKTGKVQGFEALARWTDPQFGEVEPARFIPIADDSGLIGPLTDWLLRQACTDALAWPAEIGLSFNISPVQLKDRTLGLRLLSILAETGLPPQRLEVEVTESALVRDLEAAQEILGAIRAAGVKIALDDFGTGYSSLYHLRNFKLDKIKIDRSFVEAMAHDSDSAAIVKALIGLGEGLSLAVTAEGVEDAEQQAMLVGHGCRQAQGYLFSRPVPAAEALKLLQLPRKARRA